MLIRKTTVNTVPLNAAGRCVCLINDDYVSEIR